MVCIYKITVGDEIYIGSTGDYRKRMTKHKSVCFNSPLPKKYNLPLYKAIRANDGIYDSKILYTLQDGEDKFTVEREWYDKLKPLLNINKPTKTPTNEKMTCECGAVIVAIHINRHRRTQKHINLMNPDYKKPILIPLTEEQKKKKEYHKEYGLIRKLLTVTCECGRVVKKQNLVDHMKRKCHTDIMNS